MPNKLQNRPANVSRKSSVPPVKEYPRPQLRRESWIPLDGQWEFAIDDAGSMDQVAWKLNILVPFAPETPASGIGHADFIHTCWYRREFDRPAMSETQRLILHFGAVDYSASVWVNDRLAVTHEGGYTPFEADITDLLTEDGPQKIVVRAIDDPHDMHKPRGKQDWLREAHSIWYQRTTGIWQTVWMEIVPADRITSIRWTPDVENWELGLEAETHGRVRNDLRLRIRLTARDKILVDDEYNVSAGHLQRRIELNDPGIGDGREFLLWWPHRPTLIDAVLTLTDSDGNILDQVRSYTAMRSAGVHGDRFLLNQTPYRLELVLNQGYWLESGLTAPDDAAYRRDVELIKAMGFNGVRMHQKIESPQFLHWCDQLGLLVWGEMPSAYAFSATTAQRVTREWAAAIERDYSHPCIVAWVPMNESWSVPDLPHSAQQRHFVNAIYHLTKSLDPTRSVIGNDGWELLETDIIAIHDYDRDPEKIAARYHSDPRNLEYLFKCVRPGGRTLLLENATYIDKPIMLTEFGGIAFSPETNGTWGYSRAGSSQQFAQQYRSLLGAIHSCPVFSGFCYTQFTDTYQEANGLVYMDRTPKFPIEEIAAATRGLPEPVLPALARPMPSDKPKRVKNGRGKR
ncbi:MAG: glycoside hydrolase family 2 [Planctomycetota bacterium]|nr:glycoside hydrolase family 2 [Planctomycetota bacterium]